MQYVILFLLGAGIFSLAGKFIKAVPEMMELERLVPVEEQTGLALRYGFVTVLGGGLLVALSMYFGLGAASIIYFLFTLMLTIITFVDVDTQIIPPVFNVTIFALGVVAIFLVKDVTILARVIGMLCISLPLFLIVLVIPEGFGGGDIKMMFAAGFLLGWKRTVIAFFIGLIVGGLYGGICLIRRKYGKKDHFAFGPCLAVGLALSLFLGDMLMDMYIEVWMNAMNPEIY